MTQACRVSQVVKNTSDVEASARVDVADKKKHVLGERETALQ